MKPAPDLLTSFGFPAAKIPAAVEIIRTHQPAHEPATIAGRIVRDADIFEQLGAIAEPRPFLAAAASAATEALPRDLPGDNFGKHRSRCRCSG
jgi:HD superfamily phosphodiesterase